MANPNINSNQIAIDPVSGIFFFKNSNGSLVSSSLNVLQTSNTQITTEDNLQVSGNLVVDGNLTVNGTTITINTESIVLEDKNIELGSGITTNANASGGGITLKGTTDKTFNWINSTGSWTSSENIDLVSGKVYKINGVEVLSANGYAGSAANWTNARTITLAGDLTGNVSIDGSANVTLTATVAVNSVALGTDTTGNYVSSLVSGTGISLSNNSGETATPTITLNAVIDDLTDVTITTPANGDFFRYNGSVWINDAINLSTDTIGDYVDHLSAGTGITITNNSGEASVPTISIPQSVATNANVAFNQVTAALVGAVTGDITGNLTGNVTGNLSGNVTGNLTGNSNGVHTGNVTGTASDALVWTNQRKITLDGDVTGNVFIDGSANVTLTTTIASNSVELGADTIGQYVANLVAGTGITITDNSGEGMTPVIKVADSYTTNMVSNIANSASSVSTYVDTVGSTAYSNAVTYVNSITSNKAPLANPTFTGTVTTPILVVDSIEVDTTGATSGQVLKYNGTKFAPAADNVATAGSLNITDLVDVTISSVSNGQVITWDSNSSKWVNDTIIQETPVSTLDNLDDVTLTTSPAPASGDILKYNGTVWVNDAALLATKAPLANPTFTGTVSGISKTMVGLGSVDNTADTAKPVSTAQQTALDLKANLASPALTGTPTAPTAAVTTNTTQVATTAFVRAEVAALVNSAGATLDTLGEIATALGNDANLSSTLTTSIGLKAPLVSPTFTGTVTIPSGASISGFAPLASPALTGTPTAPTAAAATNTTQVATTAFVRGEVSVLDNIGDVTLGTTYAIGDTGPAGGVIFIMPSTVGNSTGKYFEAAPSAGGVYRTWSTGANQTAAVSGADGTIIGTGAQNTIDIVAQAGNVAATSAAAYASDYTYGGFSDWFLPSRDELNELYTHRVVATQRFFD